jgi:hypothetical protein
MVSDASTALRVRRLPEDSGSAAVSGVTAIRIFLFVVLAGVVAVVGGVLVLGAFPPSPHPHAIEKVVPNDRFGAH